ncbi:hypothetical protein EIP91_007013 [Steccherinum ochraceum]|uniref:F-box domain-containing protein n=1 Tax=Steccherinum ochraceum TaxID=92696 RepID=A0A4R0RM01_9APHY|nr:hypothetical protein EIP91_007013 [Steccherinum ochraceum]
MLSTFLTGTGIISTHLLVFHTGLLCWDSADRRSAKSVALTCRAMYNPAMNALWYKLPDIDLMVVSFPIDMWHGSDYDDSVASVGGLPSVHLNRKLSFEESARLARNLERVRIIRGRGSPYKRRFVVAPDAFELLGNALGNHSSPLFPGLREFEWDWSGYMPGSLTRVLCFLPRRLEVLGIIAGDRMHESEVLKEIRTTVAHAAELFPSLKSLHCPYNSGFELHQEFFTNIMRLPNLRTYGSSLPASTLHELRLLGRHPTLQNLTFELLQQHTVEISFQPRSLFPSLRTITMQNARSLANPISIVRSILSASLVEMNVSLPPVPLLASQLKAWLESLECHGKLQKVSLQTAPFTEALEEPETDGVVDASHLTPLLSLRYLTHVMLEPVAGLVFQLSDDTIRTLAKAWPQLETLHICSSSSVLDRRPEVTLMGLSFLAQHARRLKSVKLSVDIMRPTDRELDVLKMIPSHPLSKLELFYGLPMQDPAQIAECGEIIYGLFSTLEAFDCTCHALRLEFGGREEMWEDWEDLRGRVRGLCGLPLVTESERAAQEEYDGGW